MNWRGAAAGLEKRWEVWLFEPIPIDVYALLRTLFGVLGLIALLGRTPVSMFWALDGLVPLPGGGTGLRAGLMALGFGTVAGWALFLGLAAAFAAMAVGFRTGVAVPVCFFGSLIQASWNPLPLSGADNVLIAVLFCLVFADCGGPPSVDWWLARRRSPAQTGPEPVAYPIWPLRLIQFQIALIYLNTGLWKLLGESWRDGAAIHDALNINVYHRFPYAIPSSLEWVTVLATYATLFWEIAFAVLILHPATRRAVLAFGVAMHVGIWLTLELALFSWVMIASYVAFLDPVWVSEQVRRRLRPAQRGKADTVV